MFLEAGLSERRTGDGGEAEGAVRAVHSTATGQRARGSAADTVRKGQPVLRGKDGRNLPAVGKVAQGAIYVPGRIGDHAEDHSGWERSRLELPYSAPMLLGATMPKPLVAVSVCAGGGAIVQVMRPSVTAVELNASCSCGGSPE